MGDIPDFSALLPPELPATSRYHSVEIATVTTASGRTIRHLRRRFSPEPREMRVVAEHRVKVGDRADLIAVAHLGDPLQAWRLWDANGVIHPDEIEQEGRLVRVALPDGGQGDGRG
ncbi:MAG: LysM domain-containing protein [Deltaproteobacteria bacterium]|nr:LysM domain-containing protein [Deltaproteobacteria bacterium]